MAITRRRTSRDARASTTLIPAGAPGAEGDRTYELAPMASIDAAFRSLALAPTQEESAFRGQVNPFKRLFDKNGGCGCLASTFVERRPR